MFRAQAQRACLRELGTNGWIRRAKDLQRPNASPSPTCGQTALCLHGVTSDTLLVVRQTIRCLVPFPHRDHRLGAACKHVFVDKLDRILACGSPDVEPADASEAQPGIADVLQKFLRTPASYWAPDQSDPADFSPPSRICDIRLS